MSFNKFAQVHARIADVIRNQRSVALRVRALAVLVTFSSLAGCIADFELFERPQDPVERPYHIETVRFAGGPGVKLEGELTLPFGVKRHKAVILISGSGPQNRNEELAGHRPFLVLADHLTRAGYAVLRYDDRGTGASTGNFAGATIHDFARDAAGAFKYLQSRQEIDPQNIGFLGHSEGGYIAPAAAALIEPTFMVFLAGPARPFIDVLAQQTADIHLAEGGNLETANIAKKQFLSAKHILQQQKPRHQLRKDIKAFLEEQGILGNDQEAQLEFIMDPWVLEYVSYDTRAALSKLEIPVLAIFGEKDLQVSAIHEAPAMRELLRHPKSFVEVFAGLNHLFQPSQTGLPSEYEDIETTISISVLDRIVDWMDAL